MKKINKSFWVTPFVLLSLVSNGWASPIEEESSTPGSGFKSAGAPKKIEQAVDKESDTSIYGLLLVALMPVFIWASASE